MASASINVHLYSMLKLHADSHIFAVFGKRNGGWGRGGGVWQKGRVVVVVGGGVLHGRRMGGGGRGTMVFKTNMISAAMDKTQSPLLCETI